MSPLVIVLVSLAILLSTGQADLIADICSKSTNPALCNQVLKSDPRSKGSDAQVLAQIAVDKAEAATRASISVAKSVVNRQNKEIISTCVENFNNAVDNLKDCRPLIKARDGASRTTLEVKSSAALSDIDTCSDEFGAKEPQQLKEASAKAYALVQLLLLIAKTL